VSSRAVFDDAPPVIMETGPNPVATVFWLHGLGADGHDFEPLVPELRLPADWPVRFVFPHAPMRPVTVNGGMRMRAWYDIAVDLHGFSQDEAQIRESGVYLSEAIAAEQARGVNSRHIVLAGFSQGAAIALHAGLRYPEPLAGILSLSMPIPLPDRIREERHPANARTPVFLAHGTADAIVPFAMGQDAQRLLLQLGLPVEWHQYDMPHSVCAEEIGDIRLWLIDVLQRSRRAE